MVGAQSNIQISGQRKQRKHTEGDAQGAPKHQDAQDQDAQDQDAQGQEPQGDAHCSR